MRKYLVPISIFVTGLALGIVGSFLLFNWDSLPNGVDGRDLTRNELDNSSTSQDAGKISDFHGKAANLKDLSALQDAFLRNLELYAMLANVGEDELTSLLLQSNEVEHAKRREQIQVAIVHKLASSDPSRTLRHILELPSLSQSSLIYEVYQDWAASSLEDAVAEASSLPGSQRAHALRAILETRSDLSVVDVRQIGRKLGNETLALKLNTANKVADLIEQPERAWNFIRNDETNDALQSDLLLEVVEAWKSQDGLRTLTHILAANFADIELQDLLVRAVVESDPQSAFVYAQEFPATERVALTKVIASCWARSDPKSAYEGISSVEPPSLRETLQDVVVEAWAKFDPEDVLDNIEDINTSLRSSVVRLALRELALLSPYEAIRHLNEVQKYVGEGTNIDASIVEAWSRHDPSGAVDWILTSHNRDEKRRRDLLEWVLARFVHENPNKAFEIAQQHSDEFDSELEEIVIRALTNNGQVETALEMLPRLQGPSRPIGYALVGISKIKNNEPGEVLQLAKDLQGSERGLYYIDVFEGWARFNSEQLFEQLQSFQSVHTRSLAASTLIRYNQLNPVLNESQIESAWMHLTDSDRASVERTINRNR